jgi:RNA polymerase primary sigma factor
MKAVDRFRPDKGAKLSTYASWWIKQAIRQAVSEQSRTIRLPAHVQEKLLHIRKAEARFQEELGRPPTPEELSEEVGLDPRRLSRYKEASIRPLSLEARMGDDDSDTVAEVIPDERSERPDQELAEKMDVAILNSLLPSLDARERVVLQHRFGLDGTEERTLEEIGAEFGITRERTRQIQEGALVKLRRKMQEMEAAAVSE